LPVELGGLLPPVLVDNGPRLRHIVAAPHVQRYHPHPATIQPPHVLDDLLAGTAKKKSSSCQDFLRLCHAGLLAGRRWRRRRRRRRRRRTRTRSFSCD